MTDTIPPSRRKRFARRAVMVLVGIVPLLGGYVGSYLGLAWLGAREAIDPAIERKLDETIFAPLWLYEDSNLPGGHTLGDLVFFCREAGYESQFTD